MTDKTFESSTRADLFGGLQLGDYLEVARRRVWWIILSSLSVFTIAVVVAMRLPNIYRSQTTVLVDPQKVPDSYVPTTVTTSIADRLATITQQVMSPTRLKGLRDRLKVYPEITGPGNEDRAVRKMQDSISIEVVGGGSQRLGAFQIAYTDRDPKVAALMANELAALLIQGNLKAREQQFTGAADFLEGELQDTKKQLEQKESELAAMKSKFITDLPESKQYHMEALSNLRLQMQSSQDKVNRDQQQKTYLQSLLIESNPVVDLDSEGSGSTQSPREAEIQKLESKLSSLRAHYGPSYPDVRKAEKELSDLKAKAAEEEKNSPAPTDVPKVPRKTTRNPVLEAQINKLDQEIQDQAKVQSDLQKQIEFHSSKLEQEPLFEQRMVGLMRDYDTLRAHYTHLLDKKLSADMASDLESRQQGETFVVLDSAPLPSHPAGPNRLLISLGGLFGGLFGGIGVIVLLEIADDTIRDEKEAVRIVGKAALGGIPELRSSSQIRWIWIRAALAIICTEGLSIGVGLLISLFRRALS